MSKDQALGSALYPTYKFEGHHLCLMACLPRQALDRCSVDCEGLRVDFRRLTQAATATCSTLERYSYQAFLWLTHFLHLCHSCWNNGLFCTQAKQGSNVTSERAVGLLRAVLYVLTILNRDIIDRRLRFACWMQFYFHSNLVDFFYCNRICMLKIRNFFCCNIQNVKSLP